MGRRTVDTAPDVVLPPWNQKAALGRVDSGSGPPPQSLRSRTIRLLRQRIPFIGLGVVLALLAAYWVAHRTPAPPKPPSAAALARHGCTLRQFPSAGRTHVSGSKPPSAYRIQYVAPSELGKNPDGTTVKYDSFPPTSGPHYPQWVTWGSYGKPLPEIAAVHNLEHGGVIVQYGSRVPAATVAALRRFVAASPNGMLMAPLAQLGSTIALTAWTYRATCTGFDNTAFRLFRDTFRFKGPERFPPSALAPGD